MGHNQLLLPFEDNRKGTKPFKPSRPIAIAMGLFADFQAFFTEIYQIAMEGPYGPVGFFLAIYFWYWLYFGRSRNDKT